MCTVKTMKLDFGSEVCQVPTVVVVFSVDGAELHSTTGAIFGFIRFLNQVDYVDSPLMQFPVLLAQAKESRSFFNATLPTVLAGLIKLKKRNCVDVVCVRFVLFCIFVLIIFYL